MKPEEELEKLRAETLQIADEALEDLEEIIEERQKIHDGHAVMKEGVRKMIMSNERSVRKINHKIKAKKKRNKRRRY